MSEVINLNDARTERQPHTEGTARCLDCRHEWHAVVPTGTRWFECPSCTLVRGRFIYHHDRDRPHWQCNCGSDLFCVTPDGFYCPNCGEWARGY